MPTRSLDDLFAAVARRGLRLASLFEKTGGGWRASLAPAADHRATWINAEGKSAADAVDLALSRAPKTKRANLDDIL